MIIAGYDSHVRWVIGPIHVAKGGAPFIHVPVRDLVKLNKVLIAT